MYAIRPGSQRCHICHSVTLLLHIHPAIRPGSQRCQSVTLLLQIHPAIRPGSQRCHICHCHSSTTHPSSYQARKSTVSVCHSSTTHPSSYQARKSTVSVCHSSTTHPSSYQARKSTVSHLSLFYYTSIQLSGQEVNSVTSVTLLLHIHPAIRPGSQQCHICHSSTTHPSSYQARKSTVSVCHSSTTHPSSYQARKSTVSVCHSSTTHPSSYQARKSTVSHLSLFYYTSIQLSGQEVNGVTSVTLSLFYYTSIQLSGQEVNGVTSVTLSLFYYTSIQLSGQEVNSVTSVTLLLHIHPAIRPGSQRCHICHSSTTHPSSYQARKSTVSHLSLFYYTSIQLSGQEVNGVSLSLFYYTSIQLSGQEVNSVTSVTLLLHIHPAIRPGSQQCHICHSSTTHPSSYQARKSTVSHLSLFYYTSIQLSGQEVNSVTSVTLLLHIHPAIRPGSQRCHICHSSTTHPSSYQARKSTVSHLSLFYYTSIQLSGQEVDSVTPVTLLLHIHPAIRPGSQRCQSVTLLLHIHPAIRPGSQRCQSVTLLLHIHSAIRPGSQQCHICHSSTTHPSSYQARKSTVSVCHSSTTHPSSYQARKSTVSVCQSGLFFRSLMLLLVAGSTLGHAKYGVPWVLFNVVITSALWIPLDILSTSIP